MFEGMSNGEARSKRSGKVKWIVVGALAAAVVVGGGCAYLKMRGPSGATTALGGSIPAKEAPELPDGVDRWVNGAPVTFAASRGKVVLIEGWHPA